ncbi:cupin domain-containing protein [Mycobacterium sp. Aquia_216]|uniref:cupin domain-containing protein n=1 Tax=Mycobacterium sp. Aquia_216 TaxID=2991729 RepID=UPI00227C6CDE|nr:cupin domain-containing protein [Mycobacterium sp. Aquia_216]WAJ43634.1 cupin domain-containing protein [Mycobacterium sp. Aquia_216]
MVQPCLTSLSDARAIGWIGGSEHRVILDGDMTDGRLTVMRSRLRAGSASPVHIHPNEDETIVLLSGEMVIWAGTDKWTAAEGDTVFLVRGIPHTYTVLADADLLTICTPSGMERFFERAGWDLSQGAPPEDWSVTRKALQDAATAGGQIVLGPPLAPDDEMPQTFVS